MLLKINIIVIVKCHSAHIFVKEKYVTLTSHLVKNTFINLKKLLFVIHTTLISLDFALRFFY